MSLKVKISITIHNIMHLTITRSLANKSITDLTTIPPHNCLEGGAYSAVKKNER